ncbi:glycosyltransferase [Desulforhopalus vacuolatus]|uniref:glycosyltransferase n=1 Tax=Desulforhopalus vacuolatus TaxID=40414 RepID=UPI001962E7E9|nr:glycosyltransferase [Desulforhopalus vacuolatus]MBM9519098.1 glycosyltransferase [Desulforhopalus vacuolatus]
MRRKKKITLALIAVLFLLATLITYRIYLFVKETDYQSLNARHIKQIETRLHGKTSYTFAVVGNIRNSMRIFEKRLVPLIKENDVDFMISAGNAVYDGSEGKYRLLYRGLRKMDIPYVLGVGHNEMENFGAGKFYRHFGPYFFSFYLENACFIFLDSTGETSFEWQFPWLRHELEAAASCPYRFVFLNHSPFPLSGLDSDNTPYVLEKDVSKDLQRMFSQYGVNMVFSAGYHICHETVKNGVHYIVSGGGGGLLFDRKQPYQFVKVEVGPEQVVWKDVTVTGWQGRWREKLEILKLFLHSFFYMNLFNLLLVLGIVSLVVLRLYALILRQEHLYRDFNVDEEALSQKPLRVAMFTNNYLPFIGGVSLSIERLRRGLVRQGSVVKVFAPTYPQPYTDVDDTVFRCPSLLHARWAFFPIVNIFSRKIEAAFKQFDCDLVHVHHPFWLGKKGLRLARRRDIPVILTCHTRLERYTHYFPFPGTVLKNLVAHFLIKHFANHCDAIITPTLSTEEYLRNLGVSALIETIPTGINLGDYAQWSPSQVQTLRSQYIAPGERLLLCVSRMAREKNLDFLLAGLAKARAWTSVPFTCLLVGDGPEKKRLEKKVAAMGLQEQIVFAGSLPPQEVIRCYLAADLFVFASTSETQGMVLLEAMAGGCPVVAVRASGVYDVVKDDYNGFKVAESTDAWAETVVTLLADSEKLAVLSENSRVFAETYSMERITERVLTFYRRVIVLGKSKNG